MIYKYFSNILYYDHNHTYVDTNTGELLTSVTTKIKEYQPEFPKDAAKKYAKKHKLSLEQVTLDWYLKRILGTNKGSTIHKYLEDKIQRKVFEYKIPEEILINKDKKIDGELLIDLYINGVNKMLIQADKFLKDYDYLIPVSNELVVSHKNIAGQIDYLAYDPKVDLYRIIDFKQDKKIETSNKYLKFFNTPIQHLDDCNFNKYALQTSMYRYIMEQETNLKFGDSLIIRFHESLDNYELYKPQYLSKEIKTIINDN